MPWGAIIGAMMPYIMSLFGGGSSSRGTGMDPSILKLLTGQGGHFSIGPDTQGGFMSDTVDPYDLGLLQLQLRQAQRADSLNKSIINQAQAMMPNFSGGPYGGGTRTGVNVTSVLQPRSPNVNDNTNINGPGGPLNPTMSPSGGLPPSGGGTLPNGPLPVAGAIGGGGNANPFPSYLDLLQQMSGLGRR